MSLENRYEHANLDGGDLSKQVAEITGIEAKQINDSTLYYESEKLGSVQITADSQAAFEEDLNQIEKSPCCLDKDKHDQIVATAFKDSLNFFGKYIPHDKIARLFPGIDLSSLDSFDFNSSKVRVYIFSNEDFDIFYSTFKPHKDAKASGGFTTPTVNTAPGFDVNTEISVNVAQTKIIVLREVPDSIKERLESSGGAFPRPVSEKEEEVISRNIRVKVIHELLHVLDVSIDRPVALNEGITEWYAQQIESRYSFDTMQDSGVLGAYRFETESVSILVNGLLESGVSGETIDRALLGSEKDPREEIRKVLVERYGADETDRILNWKFKSSREGFQFIAGLESKKDSEIGKFLKDYRR